MLKRIVLLEGEDGGFWCLNLCVCIKTRGFFSVTARESRTSQSIAGKGRRLAGSSARPPGRCPGTPNFEAAPCTHCNPGIARRLIPAWLSLVPLTLALGVRAAPFVPDRDAQVLQRVRISSADAAPEEVRDLRARLAREPENVSLATRLARTCLEAGRAESDPRFLGYARAALARWWDLPSPPEEILLLRATIRQRDHDFGGALSDLDGVLKKRPADAQAWLMRATILQVRGDYAGARNSCARLLGIAPQTVVVTCACAIASLQGDAARSYELLRRTSRADDGLAERQWALTWLAEIASRLGRDEAADTHFLEALKLPRRDPCLLAARADFLLDRGQPEAVVELLGQETRADALLLRLALAEKRTGAAGCRGHIEALRARFELARRCGSTVHRREEAIFELHLLGRPRVALELARANWEVQKEPADARILLEAALRAGDPEAARPVMEFLKRNRLEDVALAKLVKCLYPTTNEHE